MTAETSLAKGLTLSQLSIGQRHEESFHISDEIIRRYAEISGDNNPIHLDDAYAAASALKGRAAHGMLLAGLVSAVLGTRFPGLGTIVADVTLRFLRPIRPGEQITIRVVVRDILPAKNRVVIETICLNSVGKPAVTGQAVVLPPAG